MAKLLNEMGNLNGMKREDRLVADWDKLEF